MVQTATIKLYLLRSVPLVRLVTPSLLGRGAWGVWVWSVRVEVCGGRVLVTTDRGLRCFQSGNLISKYINYES